VTIDQLAGWLPAVVFPAAASAQIIAIVRNRDARGVSILSWSLFALANLALYAYVGRYTEPQAILSCLLTAALNIGVVGAAIRFRQGG
jgi:hypothetical protein